MLGKHARERLVQTQSRKGLRNASGHTGQCIILSPTSRIRHET
jgi:hypothetical protein